MIFAVTYHVRDLQMQIIHGFEISRSDFLSIYLYQMEFSLHCLNSAFRLVGTSLYPFSIFFVSSRIKHVDISLTLFPELINFVYMYSLRQQQFFYTNEQFNIRKGCLGNMENRHVQI